MVVEVVVAAGVAAGVVAVLEEDEDAGAAAAGSVEAVEVAGAAGAAVVVDVAGAGVGETVGAGAVVVVGHGGYIPPQSCANAEVERPAVISTRKAALGKENLNIASISFQPGWLFQPIG